MASRQINDTACDIKRRVDVIVKKCNELKVLGVPAAVVYSTSKTNGLYIVGDLRFTNCPVEMLLDNYTGNLGLLTMIAIKFNVYEYY